MLLHRDITVLQLTSHAAIRMWYRKLTWVQIAGPRLKEAASSCRSCCCSLSFARGVQASGGCGRVLMQLCWRPAGGVH
jgi:hypothetical protein